MNIQDFNVLFVVWRECVEALLVIGILNGWLSYRPPDERRAGRRWLWSGVAAGLAGALALAGLLLNLGEALNDDAQEYFQAIIVFLAAGLIVQMVFWMRRHGRNLQSDLCASLNKAADRASWAGVFVLAALAVLREGSEAAIFLYGTMASSASNHGAIVAAMAGIVAALATYGLLQLGGRFLSWRVFFRVTEKILLFLAAALLLSGVDRLIALDILPSLSSRLWDTSMFLPDSGMVGGLISGLTGYRAQPVLSQALVFTAYWIAIGWFLYRPRAVQPP